MVYSLGNRKVEYKTNDYFIANSATVIGSVIIENNVSVWFNVVIRADNDVIHIGENTNIQDGSILHVDDNTPLTIGKDVTVGHKVMLHGCSIGNNTLIGMNSVILNNAKIGKNCLIGANSLITEGKVIPDGSIVMGSPGKVVGQLTEKQIENLKHSAEHYVANFKKYKANLKQDLR
jgi:carbonic anhydrase/acetyltransferase-like protein (isoleucine patch superfamily)